MDTVSRGPLPVASLVWQARPSTWVLTVVCKATFTLTPSESPLAAKQEPIRERDAYWDDDPAQSLLEASDLSPFKQAADVVLVGRAYAPGGQPVQSLIARVLVGAIDKSIQVSCDRSFTEQGELKEGPRFTSMSLAYERAAGGAETSNPCGVDRYTLDDDDAIAVPNLLPVDHPVPAPEDTLPVIGFGPIAPSWPARRAKLGPHARAFAGGQLPPGPLPEGLDRAFFNVAPEDQRLAELRDDERIVLENLHPDHARFVTRLPGVRPRATVAGRAGSAREISMRCDTLVIDTEHLLCTATWRGQLPLAGPEEEGQVIVELDQQAPTRPALKVRAPALSLGSSTVAIDMSQPLPDVPLGKSGALPFRAGPPAPPPAPPRPSEAPASRPKTPAFAGTLELTDAVQEMKLPFATAARAPGPALAASLAQASPVEPVSPWAGAAPVAGSTPAGTIAPVAPPAAAVARSIGMALVGTSVAASPAVVLATHRDALALVWFDRKSVPRIERKPAWQRLLDELEDEPLDSEEEDPALSDEPGEIEERSHVFEILDRGAAIDVEGVHEALARAAGKRGKVVPPLELVAGELVMAFDEVEALKAMVSTATPLAEGDETLGSALAAAQKFLATPGVASAPAVADALSGRIREALGHGKKGRAELVDQQVERALLEQRHYQKRKVLGGLHLRGVLQIADEALVVYLPEAVGPALPLAVRFRARLIAAVHPAVEEREGERPALEATVVGRVVRVRC